MGPWLPAVLFAVGFIALFLELFVPAVGLLGALGLGCMVVATVFAYRSLGKGAGTLFLAGVLLLTPGMIILGLKLFPGSFAGKRLILHESMDRGEGFSSSDVDRYEKLLGKEGVAITTLRPSGTVKIEGQKYSVVTGGEMIQQDEAVIVVKVEGNRIVVRRRAPGEPANFPGS
jgi:membrane-bound serine protease (ClpP class)